MTFLKKICKDRRGVAMEMAMIVMVVVFALGALMVSVALMQSSRVRSIKNSFDERLVLEQLGEDFCKHVATGNINAAELSGIYSVSIDTEDLVLIAKDKKSGEIAMTVDIDVEDKTYEIVKWEIK